MSTVSVPPQEERLEARVKLLKEREGIRSERTLRNVFKLLDCLIGQYKLNRTDVILQVVAKTCTAHTRRSTPARTRSDAHAHTLLPVMYVLARTRAHRVAQGQAHSHAVA
eukprot:5633373-Pleurochrysis_carterae.AAC.4